MTEIRQRRRIQVDPTASELAAVSANGAQVSEGYVLVRRAILHYGKVQEEEETNELVRVPSFGTEVARLRVGASSTVNLGDYNSARVEVSVEMPCYPERSEIDRTYRFIEGILDELIPAELAKAGVTGSQQG